jgi:hypothetical protein
MTVYVDGLGRIEEYGPCSHLIFTMETTNYDMIVVKLIVPTALLPALASLLATPRLVGAQGCAVPGNPTLN